jgi:anhydro-N-acetylmuramic acid kinase
LFGVETAEKDLAVLNLGGIANLTLLPRPPGTVGGFDCGPGNALMDAWCEAHTGARFDEDGRWAAGGTVIARLLQAMLDEPFFDMPPPKSTGRDLFSLAWLERTLDQAQVRDAPARDVQATLAEITAAAAARALERHLPTVGRVLACGGGARNTHVLKRLRALLNAMGVRATVEPTSALGVPVDQVEAMAFAWLAKAFSERTPGNLPAVTGARGLRVLGALYPAA